MEIAKTDLSVDRNHYVSVFVWRTLKEMRKSISQKSGKNEDDTYAYFHAPETKIYRGNVVQKGLVGEIHLVKGRFGAGVFAHELQHFISFWCYAKKLDTWERHWEYVPKLVGKMTNKFWIWFYKNESRWN